MLANQIKLKSVSLILRVNSVSMRDKSYCVYCIGTKYKLQSQNMLNVMYICYVLYATAKMNKLEVYFYFYIFLDKIEIFCVRVICFCH